MIQTLLWLMVLIATDDCEVHLVASPELDHELVSLCSKPFSPPRGTYVFWLEQKGAISGHQDVVSATGDPFHPTLSPMMQAARIGIPADQPLTDEEIFYAMSAERAFTRSITADAQMPLGAVVMGRFNRRTKDAIAIARPVQLRVDSTTRVWPKPPTQSDLLIVLSKPFKKEGSSHLLLNDTAPDVLIDAPEQLLAIWYDLDLSRATLSLKSDVAFWEAREVRFTRGKVTTLRGELQPLPKARVTINAPLDAPRLSLEIKRLAEAKPIRRVDIGAGVHEIETLPAEPLRLTLHAGEWKMNQDVDLTSGQDTNVVFDLQPINVKGTVYYGDEPTRAEIEFRNDDEWRVVKTNEHGEYETTLWWPDVYTTRVKINGPPFLDPFREIFQSGNVDFHVPRTDYVVHVRDATTHQGIAGARVTAGSITEGGYRSAQHVVTDEDGRAVLPPVRNGELIIDVRAERYATKEPLRLTVDEKHHELDVELQPLNTVATLRFLLPNGTPAPRAEVWAFNDAMQPLWRGAANEQGELDVPEVAANAMLLVRHLNAASTIRRVDLSEKTWTLEAPAEPVTFVSEQKNALVSLWLDGVKLSGPPLIFASWSTAMMTNREGIWIGRNLPGKPLKIAVEPPAPKN
jgi:5-hydroxyisourate hydrolase-like protein (transthyretin family)